MAYGYGVVLSCFELLGDCVGFDDFSPFHLEEVGFFAACLDCFAEAFGECAVCADEGFVFYDASAYDVEP